MKNLQSLAEERATMHGIVSLTSAFEALASMRIAQIKNQVVQAQHFFDELWNMYRQIRVDSLFRFGRENEEVAIDKQLYIAITAEGGFSGDIDQRLIRKLIHDYDPAKQDIIVIGRHGASQLNQAGIAYQKYFKLPLQDMNINVAPLVREVRQYKSAVVYYQSYESLGSQSIERIELSQAVQIAGEKVEEAGNLISEDTYIFEPAVFSVVAHLERSMMDLTLSQVILDSKLAQYASRFQAMTMAKERATDSESDLRLSFNQTKRAQADERLKEMINGMKKARASVSYGRL